MFSFLANNIRLVSCIFCEVFYSLSISSNEVTLLFSDNLQEKNKNYQKEAFPAYG